MNITLLHIRHNCWEQWKLTEREQISNFCVRIQINCTGNLSDSRRTAVLYQLLAVQHFAHFTINHLPTYSS